MKKYISTLAAVALALCFGLHSASAGLLGMPLNLKAVIELADVEAPASCQFYTDDVLTGPIFVKSC